MVLPILSSQFFHQYKPSKKFFDLQKSESTWSSTLLPIYEWEGLLFIGCAQTPPKALKPHWILVQADQAELAKLWAEWMEVPSKTDTLMLEFPQDSESPESSPEAPEGLIADETFSADKKVPAEKIPSIHETISEISRLYPQVMILKVTGKTLKPFLWNEKFQATNTAASFDLSKPSPFKIVEQTHMPFHGQPQLCEVFTDFAQVWNFQKYPENAALIPLLYQQDLAAVLCCFGPNESFTQKNLQSLEALAKDLSTQLEEAPEFKAA